MDKKKKIKELLDKRDQKLIERVVGDFHKKVDHLISVIEKKPEPHFISNIPAEITVTNLKDVSDTMTIRNLEDIKVEFPDKLELDLKTKPKWYTEPSDEVSVKNVVKVKSEVTLSFITGIVSNMIEFFGKLQQKVFTIVKADSEYLKPQTVVLYDPLRKQYVDLEQLFAGGKSVGNATHISVNGGGAGSIVINGNNSFAGGTATVTTAGTRVQLPNIACKKVTIQSHESNGNLTNGGAVVIGGSDVVAASGSRNGYAIYATQSITFEVANVNRLYIDSVDSGAVITYTYQN